MAGWFKSMFFNSKVCYPFIRVFTDMRNRKLSEIPLYSKRDEDFKISRIGSIKKLEELLNIRSFIAREMVLKCKKFQKISSYSITENYTLCINNGITIETLKNNPEVLAELDISLKIKELNKLSHNINTTTPLLLMQCSKLKEFVIKENEEKWIITMSKLFEIDEYELCKHVARKPFLFSLKLDNVEKIIGLLRGFGITKEDIVKDFWVLRYSTRLIENRLIIAKENNVDKLKTWMVRANPSIFERYIKRRSDTKLILGNNSFAEYLSERLKCPEEIAKYLITKQPALQNKSLKKMNEMIDFLYKYGFQPIHIRRVPKILLHSVDTTKKRLKELESEGMQIDSLNILTKSQRQYMQYYEALIKINKSKIKT